MVSFNKTPNQGYVQDEGQNHCVPRGTIIGEERKLSALTGYSSAISLDVATYYLQFLLVFKINNWIRN